MKRLIPWLAFCATVGAGIGAFALTGGSQAATQVSAPLATDLLPPVPAPPVTPTTVPAPPAPPAPVPTPVVTTTTVPPAPAPTTTTTTYSVGPDEAALPPAPVPYCQLTATIPAGSVVDGMVTTAESPWIGTFPCSEGNAGVPAAAVNIQSVPYTPGTVLPGQ